MRFGPEVYYDDKTDHFFQRLDQFGSATFDRETTCTPKEAKDFVRSQYERFGIPIPVGCEFLYEYGLAIVYHLVNSSDPYALYWKYSDVEMTDDWRNFAFELKESPDYRIRREEMSPEKLETFRFVPGQAESFFNEYIAKPGCNALPIEISAMIDDIHEEVIWDSFTPEWLWHNDCPTGKVMHINVERICTENGVINREKVNAYFDLSMWAAVLWMFGPLSRAYRKNLSDLQDTAISYGECVVYDCEIIGPEFYTKIPRPPQSCHKCGTDAWCVENTLDDWGVTRVVCEGCLSAGMPRYDGATCGSKFCKYFECHHNAWYNNPDARMGGMRKHGQLAEMARNKAAAVEIASPREKILINA